jgi:hypothetical protein
MSGVRTIVVDLHGNPTCVVEAAPGRLDRQMMLSAMSLLRCEQACCVFRDDDNLSMAMAGGEFSLNGAVAASEAMARWWGANEPMPISVHCQREVQTVTVGSGSSMSDGASRAAAIIRLKFECVALSAGDSAALVKLPGIAHAVAEVSGEPGIDSDLVSSLFAAARHSVDASAYGVMCYTRSGDAYTLFPYVFVAGVGTWIAETSCGSGSVAVALTRSIGTRGISVGVTQPSGSKCEVSVKPLSGSIRGAGVVMVVYETDRRVVADGTLQFHGGFNTLPTWMPSSSAGG